MSRTQATRKAYIHRASRLFARYERATGDTGLASPFSFTSWMLELRNSVTSATWRQYRAAITHALEVLGKPELAGTIKRINTSGCRKRTAHSRGRRNTSARLKKTLSRHDRALLHKALSASKSRYAPAVRLMLEASRMTGLRPVEWRRARMITSRQHGRLLVVENAGNTNGRGHGKFRKLHLKNMSMKELSIINNMAELAQAHDHDWPTFYHQCRNLMGRTTRKLWPGSSDSRPSLYSARHQFAADAKKAGLSRAEIAALMGHASDRTVSQRTGRRQFGETRQGRHSFRVQPDPGNIASVRRKNLEKPAFVPLAQHNAKIPDKPQTLGEWLATTDWLPDFRQHSD